MSIKTKVISAICFIWLLFPVLNFAQTQCTDYTDLWNSTYQYDGLRLGAGNKMFIGGRNTTGPIMWGAYPSSNTGYPANYYYSGAPTMQIMYEDWGGGRLRFQCSPSAGGTAGQPVPWTDALIIGNNGNVGIGGFSADCFKLAVEGGIGCRSLKVTSVSGWCDYVFQKDYKLMSINALEKYLDANHHLPSIPSEAQVKKDGVDVIENQAALLKSIEEMSLYIIDLNKRMESMQKEIAVLKSTKN